MDFEGVRYLGLALLSTILGCISWIPANLLWTLTKAEKRIVQKEGTLMDILVDDSSRNRKGVLITLKSGKVYAGIVLSAASPGHSRPMIKVLPTYSGYRNKKNHRIVPTTNYSDAIQGIDKDSSDLFEQLSNSHLEEQRLRKGAKTDPTKETEIKALVTETKKVELQLIDLLEKKNDLGILIPVEQIMTISLYHPDIHTKYFIPLEKPDKP